MTVNDLDRLFHQYFELIPAVTDQQRRAAFRLRYEVICQEMQMPGYESWRFPDGLEIDEYDQRAVHTLLWHKPTDTLAGAVRLILPRRDAPDTPFPVEEHAANAFHRNFRLPGGERRLHTAEVSRYILAKRFRSRPGESAHTFGTDELDISAHDPRRRFPHPILGLQRAMFRMSAEQGIRHWYGIMEPALNRLLRRFALDLETVGGLIQYNGMRRPYWADVESMLERTRQEQQEIWEFVTANGVYIPEP